VDEQQRVISYRNGVDLITLLLGTLTARSDPTSLLVDFREYLSLALTRFICITDKNDDMKLLVKILRLVVQASPAPPERKSLFDLEQDIQMLRGVLGEVYNNNDEVDSAIELIKLLRIPPTSYE
jgi:hypothetical protein